MISMPGNVPAGKLIPIHEGLSTDKKYRVECQNGEKYLLRISDAARFERKRAEVELMEQCGMLGLPVQRVYNYGLSEDGKEVYVLLSWIEGHCIADIISRLTPRKRYELGCRAGSILSKLHSLLLPASFPIANCNTQIFENIDHTLMQYMDCGFHFKGDASIIEYIVQNRASLRFQRPCYLHRDYRLENMILSDTEDLWIIDWDSADFGDPWEDFGTLFWIAQISPEFANGQIHGYFGENPSSDFFRAMTLYEVCNILKSITWIKQNSREDVNVMINFSNLLLDWHHNFESFTPSWYEPNPRQGMP